MSHEVLVSHQHYASEFNPEAVGVFSHLTRRKKTGCLASAAQRLDVTLTLETIRRR